MRHSFISLLLIGIILPFTGNAQVDPCEVAAIPFPAANPNALVSVTASKTIYQDRDELVVFTINSKITGPLNYTITENTVGQLDPYVPALESGQIDVVANVPQTITFTLGRPGFLFITVNVFGNAADTGIGVEPCSIEPAEKAPDDLFTFWDEEIEQLNNIPINPIITPRPDRQALPGLTTYKMQLANIDGKIVSGWITIPNCEGPFPAVLTLPPFGKQRIDPEYFQAVLGVIAVTISIHSYDCEQIVPDNIGYRPVDHFKKKEENYYKAGILGAIQAINYIFTMPEFDGLNLAVTGQSQGGGLAMITAGLDNRVKFLAESLAALSDHYGINNDPPRSSGFPYWLKLSNDLPQLDPDSVANELYYYDAAFVGSRFAGPSLHVVSFDDETCAPATTFAALNQSRGIQKIVPEINQNHSTAQFWGAREDFWDEYLPLNPHPGCALDGFLPIELIEWKGEAKGKENHLLWKTATEKNTEKFIIQSTSKFGVFSDLGEVKAVGNSQIEQAYQFIDQSPDPNVYYRLKVIDQDGSYEFSEIIQLSNQDGKSGNIQVVPNPFQDQLFLEGLQNFQSPIQIQLFNNAGQLALDNTVAPQQNVQINSNELPKGFYTYIIRQNGALVQQGKLVKAN